MSIAVAARTTSLLRARGAREAARGVRDVLLQPSRRPALMEAAMDVNPS